MTYWVYKLTYDCGTAPHVRDGLLSLAICKPRIREGAAVGDVLFGFSGRSRKVNRGERLIYVAEVTEKLAVPGEYYERPEFRHRWDCIYERKGERLVWRAGSLTHEGEECRAKDLGPAPSYPRAIVLLSDEVRYLGTEGTMDYAGRWPDLATFVHELGIGERHVEPQSAVGRKLTEVRRELWRTRDASKVGAPTEPPTGEPAWGTTSSRAGAPAAANSCSPAQRAPTRRRPVGTCG
jgi:hypothetical protein